jgi:quinoprotein glucose dehydrogenase
MPARVKGARKPTESGPGRGMFGFFARGMISASLIFLCGWGAGCSSQADPAPKVAEVRSSGQQIPEREWRSYLGARSRDHFSPLEQINRDTVADLEVAWVYDAGGADPAGGTQIQFNPLIVKGVLYGASPTMRFFALDAATGEELWSFDPGAEVEVWTATRGAVYWSEGEEERIFFGVGPYLYALDPLRGTPITSFAERGRLDLREGLGRDVGDDIMGVVLTTPPALFDDVLIVGGRVNEMAGAAPGHVRAFDARTGEMRWIFHTIPLAGQFGADTWQPDAAETAGGANAWAGMAVDEERGLVFVPTGSAAGDFFGGDRPGDNLFANSLVALDARDGTRRWHQQIVHHDLWDRDLPAPPNLIVLQREGIEIPAVAQVTKTGDTYVFHRDTGESLFPVEERPVPSSTIDGEVVSPTQPRPLLPQPFVRQEFTLRDVTDRNETAALAVRESLGELRYGPLFEPPSLAGTIQYPGLDGGAEWGGAAWNEQSQLLFVNANQVPWIVKMVAVEKGFDPFADPAGGYTLACAGCHGMDMKGDGAGIPSLLDVTDRLSYLEIYRIMRDGRGRMPAFGGMTEWWELAGLAGYIYFADEDDAPAKWAAAGGDLEYISAGYQRFLDPDFLPASRPPWGTFSAIDLQTGDLRWQVPLGDYPKVLASGDSGLGAENYGGPVATAGGLLFLAATPDSRFRAFDQRTGEVLWQADLPAPGFATPATYEVGGRQFVVIAAGGGKLEQPSGSSYVAFALP